MARTCALGAQGRQFKSARSDMKKIYIFIGAIVILIGFAFITQKIFRPPANTVDYILNGKTYRLLTATTQAQWEKGLMFYRKKSELKGADGMIFIFPSATIESFWNENTYLDLELYWIRGKEIIGKNKLPSILKSKSIVTVVSPGAVDKVIELVQ